MEDKTFRIPDSTYNIPLKEFYVWYDAVLSKKWKDMSDDEKNEYFKDADLEKIKNKATAELLRNGLKGAHLRDHQSSFTDKIYYRIIEFQKLDNDVELLQAMVRRFISQKAINKMLSQNGTPETPYIKPTLW